MYGKKKIANYYGKLNHLFEPEKVIFSEFKDRLKDMRMLDIGVGGGRTTNFFAKYAKEYTGIDCSKAMIDICKKRFPELEENFFVCDVRDLERFKSNHFDFVLFSFNGIDHLIKHEERMQALHEIKRVCREGGVFCFSSHNLMGVDKLFELKPSNNPVSDIKLYRR